MADTEAARTDMRFAYQYFEHKHEAREYVTSARRKDPNVTLAVKTESKTVAELTPNSLEADILVQQTRTYSEQIDALTAEMSKTRADRMKVLDRDSKKLLKLDGMAYVEEHKRQQVEKNSDDQLYSHEISYLNSRIGPLRAEIIKCLLEAINLNPLPNFYALLGAAYVDQKNFAGAIELLTPIQQKNPENFEIRRALDSALKEQTLQNTLETAPVTYHPPPSEPFFQTRTKVFILSILLGFVFTGFASQAGSGHEIAMFILFSAGVICWVIAYFVRVWL
jgi:tetratricopeptide (TPR) repeat protein